MHISRSSVGHDTRVQYRSPFSDSKLSNSEKKSAHETGSLICVQTATMMFDFQTFAFSVPDNCAVLYKPSQLFKVCIK